MHHTPRGEYRASALLRNVAQTAYPAPGTRCIGQVDICQHPAPCRAPGAARFGLSAYAFSRQLVSISGWGLAERFYEGREHLLDFLRLVCEVSVLVRVQVTEVVGQEQMVLQFARRTHRDFPQTFSSRKSLTTKPSPLNYRRTRISYLT